MKSAESSNKIPFEEAVKNIHRRIGEFQTKIQDYLDHHRSLTPRNMNHLHRLCLQERRTLEVFYPNKNTQHCYFTKYRNAITGHGLPEKVQALIKDHLRLGPIDAEGRSRSRDERIDWRTNHVTLFEAPVFLQTCREFLDRSLGELQEQGRTDQQKDLQADPALGRVPSHPAFYTLLIGLLGLTGRRPIEVLKTGAFRWEDPHHVFFSGQTKTKGSPQGRDSYLIPVLDDAQKVVRGLEMIRRILPLSSWENERVGQTFAGRIARHLRPLQLAILPESPHLLNVRSLRSLYVTTAYELFNMRERSSFNAFAARVLGHSHLDKNTANCYTYFALKSPLPEGDGKTPMKKKANRRKS